MNRVFIVGNGFDLAHGLKTSYDNFILPFLEKYFANIASCYEANLIRSYTDEFVQIQFDYQVAQELKHYNILKKIETITRSGCYFRNGLLKLMTEYFKVKSNGTILNSKNWFDIEQEYFTILSQYAHDLDHERVSHLNKFLTHIKNELKNYIAEISSEIDEKKVDGYSSLFKNGTLKKDLKNVNLGETLILNFNYTDTITKKYQESLTNKTTHLSIHGSYHDDIVFGYGDEMTENFRKIENINRNEYLDFFKSHDYFKNFNYRKLQDFIESKSYEVFIVGHSCGLSDRLLLNYIFEHDNCRKIRLMPYIENSKNNFLDLTKNVSRHFNNKLKMRQRVLPFDESFYMPQIE